jgi:predicted PurR-regulated permease PerM
MSTETKTRIDRPDSKVAAHHDTHSTGESQTSIDDDANHRELRTLRRLATVAVTLALFYTLYFAKNMLMPMALAVMLSLVLKPIMFFLRRLRVPNIVSASLLFAIFVTVTAATALLLSEPLSKWLAELPRTMQSTKLELRDMLEPFVKLQQATEQASREVDEMTQSPDELQPVSVRIEQPPLTSQWVNATGSMLASIVITTSLLFFLLAAGDRFLEKTVELVPTWRGKREVVALFRDIQHKISTYLGSITLINIGLGVVIGTGLWLIGMPNAVLWGVLAALLNYIPFVGLIAGAFIVTLAALSVFDSLPHAMLAPLIYLGANGIEANFATPAILGRTIDLNPVVILLAVFLFGWVWGVVGVFLAVPILICVRIVAETYETSRPLSVYLSQ